VSIGRYTVLPIPANHNVDLNPFNFLVSDGDAAILYACDTGPYPESTWDGLRGRTADAFIIECTVGLDRRGESSPHLGLPNVVEFKSRADVSGLARVSAHWVITHFSHHSGLLHDELVELANIHGLVVGFDGMVFEIP
jgi:phosphoribosyl 1,2-cyclic phosphate phosphodiesterase